MNTVNGLPENDISVNFNLIVFSNTAFESQSFEALYNNLTSSSLLFKRSNAAVILDWWRLGWKLRNAEDITNEAKFNREATVMGMFHAELPHLTGLEVSKIVFNVRRIYDILIDLREDQILQLNGVTASDL